MVTTVFHWNTGAYNTKVWRKCQVQLNACSTKTSERYNRPSLSPKFSIRICVIMKFWNALEPSDQTLTQMTRSVVDTSPTLAPCKTDVSACRCDNFALHGRLRDRAILTPWTTTSKYVSHFPLSLQMALIAKSNDDRSVNQWITHAPFLRPCRHALVNE